MFSRKPNNISPEPEELTVMARVVSKERTDRIWRRNLLAITLEVDSNYQVQTITNQDVPKEIFDRYKIGKLYNIHLFRGECSKELYFTRDQAEQDPKSF